MNDRDPAQASESTSLPAVHWPRELMNNHADASPKPKRGSAILGWIAVVVSSLIACFWALWGIIENFHEGWYYRSTLMNLSLMLIQYLSPMLAFVVIPVIAIVAPRLGSILYVLIGVLAAWFFRGSSWTVVYLSIVTPLMLLAVLFWYGRPHPRRRALWLVLGLPGLTLLIAGIGPAIHVFRRVDDGDRGARLVTGNQVALVWAPAGPGWPNRGVSWDEANRRSRYLKADGLTLADSPQDIWRACLQSRKLSGLRPCMVVTVAGRGTQPSRRRCTFYAHQTRKRHCGILTLG